MYVHPALSCIDQQRGKLAAGLLVELVAFHVDPGARGVDRFGQRSKACLAVDQQGGPVAFEEFLLGVSFALVAHQRQRLGRRRLRRRGPHIGGELHLRLRGAGGEGCEENERRQHSHYIVTTLLKRRDLPRVGRRERP